MVTGLIVLLPTLGALLGYGISLLHHNWASVGQVERVITPHFRADWVMPKYTWEIKGNGWSRGEMTYNTKFQATWNVWVAYLATKLRGTHRWN